MLRLAQSKNIPETQTDSDNKSVSSDNTLASNLELLSLDLDGTELEAETTIWSLYTVTSCHKATRIPASYPSSEISNSESVVTVRDTSERDIKLTSIYRSNKLFSKMAPPTGEETSEIYMLKFKKALMQWDDIYKDLI